MVTSFAPQAQVDIKFHRDITPIVIGGEELGFSLFGQSSFELPDGKNQVVFRVAKLVERQGEKEKFNSTVLVATFDAQDDEIFIEPGMTITRVEQAEAFNKTPNISFKSKSGNDLNVQQEALPALPGITRDYEKELARYNKNSGIAIATAASVSVDESTLSKPSESVVVQTESDAMTSESMVQYWYEKADSADKETFVNWAFSNRKQPDIATLSGNKPLEMMSYWYAEADMGERKSIFSWLMAQ